MKYADARYVFSVSDIVDYCDFTQSTLNRDHCRCHGRCMSADPYKISLYEVFAKRVRIHTPSVSTVIILTVAATDGVCMLTHTKISFKRGFAIGSAYIHRLCRQS